MPLLDFDSFKNSLSTSLSSNLPGPEAQLKMSTQYRNARPDETKVPASAKKAAVLLLLYPKNEAWHLVFMKRTSKYKGDKHKGQISFPGGQYETIDQNLQNTAIREAGEEVGIDPKTTKVLGALTELFIPVSNFLVQPFVAISQETPSFTPDPAEVEAILEIPLGHFQSEKSKIKTKIKLTEFVTINHVPAFQFEETIIWGATAMILSEFLDLSI